MNTRIDHASRFVKSQCATILSRSLQLNCTVGVKDFEFLKTFALYQVAQPQAPALSPLPNEPKKSEQRFAPKASFASIFSANRRLSDRENADAIFAHAYAEWEAARQLRERLVMDAQKEYEEALGEWASECKSYYSAQEHANASIDSLVRDYSDKETRAVLQVCAIALRKLQILAWVEMSCQMQYEPTRSQLVVDFRLPTLNQLFSLEKVAPNTEVTLKKREKEEIYESSIRQMWLSVVYALFESDSVAALDEVVFNGIIDTVDPATGHNFNACVMSVRTTRIEFAKLNLSAVDPIACFKSFKGIGATKIHSIVPVQPIIAMKRNDDRFVPDRDVTSALNAGVNLATIGWEEFEHLIRQLFEQEFAKNNGEVRVTKASRDGGVDAVIFDPDPIHGGKIVVQAKRYTNTVGVGAVRELYGTVVNEGASKGILVTTSSFGPDAYAFAANKPLTLLDGQNLLYLLDKHGHQAHIDLISAKALGVSLNRYSALNEIV